MSAPSSNTARSALNLLAHHQSPNPSTGAIVPLPPQLSVADESLTAPSSSASSVSGVELNLNDVHTSSAMLNDVGSELVDAEGEVKAAEGDTAQALRDSLKKSMLMSNQDDVTLRARRKSLSVTEASLIHEGDFGPRQYFILTHAGKPVFMTRQSHFSEEELTNAMGIMQALISVYADENDKLRCINAGKTRITFLLRAPLYYACVSSWGEPESISRLHLEYLHLQILSVVTASQLSKIFEKRTNFDLRRLLDGTESFLHTLIRQLQFDMSISTASLNVLKIDPGIREKIAEALLPAKDMKDTLYILLFADQKVVTLVRPRKHSVHPADLHLLVNTVSASALSSTLDSSSWLPICLPKFNPNGFLHALVSYMSNPSEKSSETESESQITSEPPPPMSFKGKTRNEPYVGLAVVTANRDGFERLQEWTGTIIQTLRDKGWLGSVFQAAEQSDFTASSLGIPGLRHFIYKSRTHVQLVSPTWEEPYGDVSEQKRLVQFAAKTFDLITEILHLTRLFTLYQLVHDALHARSGQPGGPLKLQYIRTDTECILGWVTSPFELYIALSPKLPKSAAVSAANALTRWVKKNEAELFLKDAPVF